VQAEHWSETGLFLEGGFVSGLSLHTRAESRDPPSSRLETHPQHLLLPKQYAFTFQRAKQSKAGILVTEITQTKGLDGN